MVNNLKQKTKNAQPLWRYILSPKRVAFFVIASLIFTGFALVTVGEKVSAATGINQTINFQGKVVNSNGTNVADGQYTFVFKIYDAASGGANPWTETQNNVQVTAGVFRVSLGSVTPISGVDFNTDNIYLGINFNSDGEMTPRVRFASVPYAMNAKTVAGLTVTDTTGTLTIANSKVFTVNNTIGFSGTDGTTFTLPVASGTIVTLDASQILVNKTIGSSGLIFSGASTDITTGTNESLTIAANGTGNVLIQSGSGGQAALIVDKTGSGDIFAASSSGVPKFIIKSDGTASSSAGFVVDGAGSVQSTNNQTLTVGGGSTGDLVIGRTSQRVYLPGFDTCTALETSGGILSCGSDASGGGDNFWQYNAATGIVANGNLTTDFLLGGTSTASAKFAVLGIAAGENPTASVSATSGQYIGNGIVIAGNGTIQSLRNNTLTLGGNTSGELVLKSRNVTVFQNPGTGNTLLGENAGSLTTSATSNTFVGFEAGLNNSANSNTFVGYTAGRTNGAGATNTFVGQSAGYANNGGSANAYFGFEAGRYSNAGNNTFIGQRAGYTNNSGANNVFLGFEAGESPVGANANLSGANNVFVGYQSGPGSTTQLTNATAIGYQALVNASNALVLGGTGANAVQIGIGTTTPLAALNVVGGNMGGNAAMILNQTGVSTNDIFAASSSGTTKFVIKNDGTASSSAGFTIDGVGSLQSTNNQTLTVGGGSTGNLVIGRTSQRVYLPGFDTCTALETSGGILSCGSDASGGGDNFWQYNTSTGIIAPGNLTTDLLLGGTATQEAKFAVLGIAGTDTPVASISAIGGSNDTKGIYLSGDGSIQSVRNNTLTIGGGTTGHISLMPNNGGGKVGIGTSSPLTALDITQNVNGGVGINITNTSSGNAASQSLGLVESVTGGKYGSLAYFLTNYSGSGLLNANTMIMYAGPNVTNGLVLDTVGNVPIRFATGGTADSNERLRISGTGEIGIGTTSPIARLHVTGIYGNNAAMILNQGNAVSDIFAASSSGVTKFVIKNDGTASSSAGFTIDSAGTIQTTNAQTLTVGSSTTGNIAFVNSIGLQRMLIDQTGRVSLGLGLPATETLNVAGNATMSGYLVVQNGTAVNTSIRTHAMGTLSIGGSTTGEILFNSGSNSVKSLSNTSIFAGNKAGNAALIVDQLGSATNDIFTASASGATKFSITNSGIASSSAGFTINGEGNIQSTNNNQLVLGGVYTGDIVIAPRNSGGRLNLNLASSNGLYINNTVGAGLTAGNSCISDIVNGIVTGTTACAAVGGGGNFWQYNSSTGIIAPGNLTAATLFGDTASLSATFRINGSAGSGINPVASVSANTSYAGFVFDQRGVGDVLTASTSGVTQLVLTNNGALGLGLGNGNSPTAKLDVNGMASISSQLSFRNGAGAVQTTGNNSLTIGGSTTGDVYLRPGNSQGLVKLIQADTGTSGLLLTTSEANNTDKIGRIKFGSYLNSEEHFTGIIGSGEVSANQLFIGGGSTTENAATIIRFRTASAVNTTQGTERMRIDNKGWVGIGEIGDANTALQSQLYVTGGSQGANAAAIINQTGISTNDIFAASASGTTKFVIKNDGTASLSGNIVFDGAKEIQTTKNQTLTIGGSSTGDINIVDSLFLGVDELTNGGLTFYSSGVGETDPSIYADANGNLILSAPTGSVQIGDGTGNISFSLETAADVFIADKTVTLSTNYSSADFTFQRVLTGGANNQGGAVFTIKDISGGSGTINGDVLLVNSALTSGNFTGYLARFQQNGVDKFRIQGNGTTAVASVAATTSFAGMVVDNTIGDLFTASSSGVTQLVLTNNGALGLGLPAGLRPTAKLDVNGAASISGQLVFRSGTGVIQTTGKGTFTIGGDTTGDVFIKPGNTTGLTFLSNGRVGIGTTTPLSTLDVRAQNGTISVASVAGATSFASFVVDNSIGDLFTASSSGITRFTIQQSGTVQIGNLTNGLTFDYLNGGPNFTGSARPTKAITLSPEFAGGILTASGSSTTNGSMTSDASASAVLNRTYYEWSSTQTAIQDYVVALRITLPSDFSGWSSGTALTINYNTGDTATTANGMDIYMYNPSDDSTGRPVYFSTNNVSSVDKTWTTVNLTAGQLDNNNSPDWDAAGETVVVYFKLKASGTYNYTQIGDIVINYLSKF